jgi:RimJ/RimL family protein N-acetyltransferase
MDLVIAPIETARLRLRIPCVDDLPSYLAYRNEPVSLEAQVIGPMDQDQARSLLSAQSQLNDDALGWKMFALDIPGTAGLIGEVGVFLAEDRLQGDIGWWLHSDHQGQGFDAEAAAALLFWCYASRGLHRVTANCLAVNVGSRKIMQKIGLRLESETIESRLLGGKWRDEVSYAMLRREWRGDYKKA